MATWFTYGLVCTAVFCSIQSAPADAGRVNLNTIPQYFGGTVLAMKQIGCEAGCADDSPDSDGDGVSACVEACLGTSDASVDSDGDGMPDGFEYEYGLDPLALDENLDKDGDEYSNLEEFLAHSNPADASSPHPVYYVSPSGADETSGGDRQRPWAHIQFALTNLVLGPDGSAQVVLFDGVYPEDLTLPAGVTLAAARGSEVTIVGQVTGAEGAVLKRLTLEPGPSTQFLLDMNDVAMTLEQVVLQGDVTRSHTGVLVDGTAPARSVFDRCVIRSLGVGVDIGDAVPTFRRCLFEDFPVSFGPEALPGAAIYIRENGKDEPAWRSIGDASDPANGWNDFLPTIEGFAVINERDEAVVMQDNYWGVTDVALFPTRVNGAADVLPILYQSSSVIASTLLCTVWEEGTQKRVTTASIDLNISPFDAVRDNADGVYAFPCLAEGTYDIEVQVAGYQRRIAPVTLRSGEIASISVVMKPLADGSGPEGIANLLPALAGCSVASDTATSFRGDAIVLVITLLALFRWSGRRHPATQPQSE